MIFEENREAMDGPVFGDENALVVDDSLSLVAAKDSFDRGEATSGVVVGIDDAINGEASARGVVTGHNRHCLYRESDGQ